MNERIIDGVIYNLDKRYLLCEVSISKSDAIVDLSSKTKRLYYIKGKEFILETIIDLSESVQETKKVSEDEAKAFMNKYSQAINKKVYTRYFGKPKEL